jgi:hypothetical protein
MSPPAQRKGPALSGAGASQSPSTGTRGSYQNRGSSQVDPFREINSHTIAELWVMLGLPGEPKSHGSMRSPFRDERTPSFSIHDDGHAFKDHGTDEGGDGVEFARIALRTDPAGVRAWWLERSGIDYYDHGNGKASSRPAKGPQPPKVIQWPGELVEGTEATWQAFATTRGITYAAAWAAVGCGLVRFVRIDGKACYVVTDPALRNAEIRRFDGSTFNGKKAYPLPGPEKAWPVGCELLKGEPKKVGVFLCEGATDFVSAIGLLTRYRRAGGSASWIPLGILGAHCKTLAPDAAALIRGRRARIAFDADKAGEDGAAHWREMLLGLGCEVGVVTLPIGKDLTDVAGEIELEGLFE